MFKALLVSVCLLLAGPALAETRDTSGADQVVERLFTLLQNGDTAKAYAEVGRGTLMEQKKVELQNLANQTANALQIYGKIIDWDLIDEAAWGSNYRRRNYLVRTPGGPLFFNVHLYRGQSGWTVGQIYFTDTPDKLPAV